MFKIKSFYHFIILTLPVTSILVTTSCRPDPDTEVNTYHRVPDGWITYGSQRFYLGDIPYVYHDPRRFIYNGRTFTYYYPTGSYFDEYGSCEIKLDAQGLIVYINSRDYTFDCAYQPFPGIGQNETHGRVKYTHIYGLNHILELL